MAFSNTDLERAYYLNALGITEAQASSMSFSQLLQAFYSLGTSSTSFLDKSSASPQTIRGMLNVRKTGGDAGDSPVLRVAGDTSAGNIQMRHEGDYGYLFHLTMGEGSIAPWAAIGIGNDFGTGAAILIANKNTGKGIKLLNYAAIASSTAYAIHLDQKSALASGLFLEQTAAGAAPVLDCVGNVTQDGDKLIRVRHATNGEFGYVDSNTGELLWERVVTLIPPSPGGSALQVASNRAISFKKNDGSGYRQGLLQDAADKIILGDQNSAGAISIRAGGATAITLESNGQVRATVDSQGITLADGKAIFTTGTGGLLVGRLSTHYIGFFGKTPVQQPSGTPAASTDLASVISLVNSLRTNLLALGLVA